MAMTTSAREGSRTDNSSLSNPHEVSASHLALCWEVDFEKRVISGSATYTVQRHVSSSRAFTVDTSGGLSISKVFVDSKEVSVRVARPHAVLGTALTVPLPVRNGKNEFEIKFEYSTHPEGCSAAQWLEASQTADKKRPYLFTQSQAIHARSLMPCQDCPGAKLTWEAKVTCPAWATALMSGLAQGEEQSDGKKTSLWRQPLATSTYLIAIVCADLASREISPRCRVWSEPSVVGKAAAEFAQTEDFLKAAESITGLDYAWGRYDLVCLAPSFPYGGMENPCLTFVTPTLLAGDKSLAGVVAHEIAHSWTGNLVTNATWSHFWLNEGWTRWLERKIKAHVATATTNGEEDDDRFEQLIDFDLRSSLIALQKNVEHLEQSGGGDLTALCPPLEGGVDPDEAFSLVPYEKGSALLHSLEHLLGSEVFGELAKKYISKFANSTVTTLDFKNFFIENAPNLKFDWEAWIHAPGMPPALPWVLDETVAKRCRAMAGAWSTAAPSLDLRRSRSKMGSLLDQEEWANDETLAFLDFLTEKKPDAEALAALDSEQLLSTSQNAEVKLRWVTLLLAAGVEAGVPLALEFVTTQGRMKFVRPLYRALAQSSIHNARERALAAFKIHADFYHPICRKMVANDLKVNLGDDDASSDKRPAVDNKGQLLLAALTGAALVFIGLAIIGGKRR